MCAETSDSRLSSIRETFSEFKSEISTQNNRKEILLLKLHLMVIKFTKGVQ